MMSGPPETRNPAPPASGNRADFEADSVHKNSGNSVWLQAPGDLSNLFDIRPSVNDGQMSAAADKSTDVDAARYVGGGS